MPARTGAEYIAGLRDRAADIYIGGEKVADVTRHPAFAGGLQTVAGLLDMQHDPATRDEMTYTSPSTGDPVGLSFIMPRNAEGLARRRRMMRNWAKFSCGMMGRTPDFLNVAVMSMAAAADYSGQNRSDFKQNILDYYEYIRENDIVMTHTLVNLQRSRSIGATPFDDRTEVALSVVKETDAGIVVRGARVLATLGPLSDEIAVYPARTRRVPAGEEGKYAFGFAIPCNTDGLKFQCRDTVDLGRSHFDHPAGSRFEEMDAIVFFDDVLVPWERVFLYNDVALCNQWGERTNRNAHTGHQVVTKNVVKCEFMLGLATPDGGHAGVRRTASDPAPDRRNHREPGDHQGAAGSIGGAGIHRRMGHLLPRLSSPAGSAQKNDRYVPTNDGDTAPARLQQPDGTAGGGRSERPAGRGHSSLYGYGHRHCEGTHPPVPLGVGRFMQRVRQSPDAVRTVFRWGRRAQRGLALSDL